MLTGKFTREVEIPHESGQKMTFRTLSGKTLEKARDKRSQHNQEMYVGMLKGLGSDTIKAVQEAESARKAQAESEIVDSVRQYDGDTVLYSGIVSWTYDEPVCPETIDMLDEETRNWAIKEIIKPTLPISDDDRLERFLPSTAQQMGLPMTE